ncbi:NUDIX domain-containing protein [Streptacidiphilus jiangxiensis]|uniref:8-oxo-dGTP pyrophosphatase MutT, NUDIX family n=1 Tax=Streptacidiphilus jiangxiensis TaxID=235985 RepID=A0A1H7NQK7_STRJI|nr:NUDIX domain-containing protein [Streptacidiphilus jiangxiensis]SEL25338.1 8-oxo-dGTP pyrophosphatase MutT, NUDIX family [Streptacidiphilus jiangxiensis]
MTKTWIDPTRYSAGLPKVTVFATLVFTDPEDRLLQLHSVNENRLQRWQLPGGNHDDPTESPWQVAVRETEEETGIRFAGPPLLLGVQWIPPRPYWPFAHQGFFFHGGRLTPHQMEGIRLDPDEHTHWQVRTLADWRPDIPDEQFEQLSLLLAARPGTPAYVETPAT